MIFIHPIKTFLFVWKFQGLLSTALPGDFISVHISTTSIFKIHFNIMLPPTVKFKKFMFLCVSPNGTNSKLQACEKTQY